jgi:hypothetical protein
VKGLVFALAALQALLLVLPALSLVIPGPMNGPMKLYCAGALLFALPPLAAVVLVSKMGAGAPRRRAVQAILAVGLLATFAGYLDYGAAPSPGRGLSRYGELASGGPVFGVSIGMSRDAAAKALIATGRFKREWNWCLAPGTFEISHPEGVKENPSEQDCKGGGLDELWQAGPLYFGEFQMLDLHIRSGHVVHMKWSGGGNIIG